MAPGLKNFSILGNPEDQALIWRIIADNAGRHWRKCALAVFMTMVSAGCTAAIAYMIGNIINATYLRHSFYAVGALSFVWMLLFAIRGLAAYWQDILMAQVGNRITAETQTRICDKLLGQGVSYYADRHSSEFMAKTVLGASSSANVLNLLVLALGRDLLTLLGLIAVMVWQDPLLALIGLLVLPPALFGVERLVAIAREIAGTQMRGSWSMLGTLQEAVQGFKVVKAFRLENAIRSRVAENVTTLEHASNRLAKITLISSPLIEVFGGFAAGLAFLYGGYRVLEANASPGELVSFMMAFIMTFDFARRLARVKVDIGSNLVPARALYELFDSRPAEPDDSGNPALDVTAGRIVFENVSFAYREDTPVLRGLSFVAEPGRMTALVGPSGAGKTTVFNLLLRFYDTASGSIAIDGQELRNVSRSSLRARIAYVGQEVYLFNGSIRDNILNGRPDATEAEIHAAAKAALAHEFILAFPDGYDTFVGETGSQLSAGQRQRVALARAFIKDAPIILLDEATASLDSESERYVQDAIRRLCAGRTTLVIAHRLNTIRDADAIHVVEQGVIVESGSHEALIRRNGKYANFVHLQFGEEVPDS